MYPFPQHTHTAAIYGNTYKKRLIRCQFNTLQVLAADVQAQKQSYSMQAKYKYLYVCIYMLLSYCPLN